MKILIGVKQRTITQQWNEAWTGNRAVITYVDRAHGMAAERVGADLKEAAASGKR